MNAVRNGLFGVALAAVLWAVLVLTQNGWHRAVTQLSSPSDPAAPMVVLLITGFALGLVVRFVPTASLWVASASLLLVTAPVSFGLGSWWPDAFPGSSQQLGIHAGTYIVLGVMAAGACLQSRSTRRPAPSEDGRSPALDSREG